MSSAYRVSLITFGCLYGAKAAVSSLLWRFIACFLLAASAERCLGFQWTIVNKHGRDYISLEDIQRFYGFPKMQVDGKLIWLRSTKLVARFEAGTSELMVNKVLSHLCFPLEAHEGNYYVSRMDLSKVIDPVIKPSHLDLPVPRTIILDALHGADTALTEKILQRIAEKAKTAGWGVVSILRGKATTDDDVIKRCAEIANSLYLGLQSVDGSQAQETFLLAPQGVPATGKKAAAADLKGYLGNACDGGSRALATSVQANLLYRLHRPDGGVKTSRETMLRGLTCPSVIIRMPMPKLNDSGPFTDLAADAAWKGVLNFHKAILAGAQAPGVEIIGITGPGIQLVPADATTIAVRYKVKGWAKDLKIRITLDGVPVKEDPTVPKAAGEEVTTVVAIGPKSSVIYVMAVRDAGEGPPEHFAIARDDKPAIMAGGVELKPALRMVVAGVSDYVKNDQFSDLSYAAKDARDFAAVWQSQKGTLYSDVTVKLFAGEDATAANILDALEWLKKETTTKDVAVIFLAGHGENDSELRYYFCPRDYDQGSRLRTGVSFDVLRQTIQSLAGKVVVFVDTCHAGNALGKLMAARGQAADIKKLAAELASEESGAVVFASSTGRQVSMESDELKNGVFTKALIEGLSGKAAAPLSGKVTVATLEHYVAERVKALTNGAQTPTVAKPQTVSDFLIAVPPTAPEGAVESATPK